MRRRMTEEKKIAGGKQAMIHGPGAAGDGRVYTQVSVMTSQRRGTIESKRDSEGQESEEVVGQE